MRSYEVDSMLLKNIYNEDISYYRKIDTCDCVSIVLLITLMFG